MLKRASIEYRKGDYSINYTRSKHLLYNLAQGCTLSPSIFNSYFQESIDILREKVNLSIKMNIAVIAENEEELQWMLRRMEETLLNELNMKINTKNTKVLLCRRNNSIQARIHLQNQQAIDASRRVHIFGQK